MPKFRKKPIEIEAVQWTGDNHREMFNFLGGEDEEYIQATGVNFYIDWNKVNGGLIIKTLEGEHIASIGDWIIKGVQGEYYPCKPDIFETTYEVGKKEEYHPIDSDNDHYQMGYNHGKSIGYNNGKTDAMREAYNIAITPDFIKGYNQAKGELEHQIQKKYKEGYADGKTDGYKESYHEVTIEKVAQFNKGYDDGFEEGKSAGYDEGYEIGKNTVLKLEDYDKGYKVGYEAGKVDNPNYMTVYEAGRNHGFDECKRDSISAKEIPGEYLSRIEEARLMGYEEGRSDCKQHGWSCGYDREATLQKKLLQEHIMESGDDEEDGEPIGPEQTEYAKGYYEGYEDGRNKRNYFRQNK